MKILIVEDEPHAQKRLKSLIQQLRPATEVLEVLDSIDDTIAFFQQNAAPDLLFLDIQLSDGLSFEIFQEVELKVPVIFTTAFDEYAIKAFKVNSIDYLLKPVEIEELERAIEKYEQHYAGGAGFSVGQQLHTIRHLVDHLVQKEYPKRFLIKSGPHLSYVQPAEIAYCFSEKSMSFLMTKTGKKYTIDYSLEDFQALLPPDEFFRINRSMIVHVAAVGKVSPYFNQRLALTLQPQTTQQALVSRERVKDFKQWLGV